MKMGRRVPLQSSRPERRAGNALSGPQDRSHGGPWGIAQPEERGSGNPTTPGGREKGMKPAGPPSGPDAAGCSPQRGRRGWFGGPHGGRRSHELPLWWGAALLPPSHLSGPCAPHPHIHRRNEVVRAPGPSPTKRRRARGRERVRPAAGPGSPAHGRSPPSLPHRWSPACPRTHASLSHTPRHVDPLRLPDYGLFTIFCYK